MYRVKDTKKQLQTWSQKILDRKDVPSEIVVAKKQLQSWTHKIVDRKDPSSAMVTGDKQLQSWSERLTDSNNLWLDATRSEDEGYFLKASTLYMEDAIICWKNGFLGRAALSSSCAASCLAKIRRSDVARIIYKESAKIYEENALLVLDRSIREALWSLQRAFEIYTIASEEDKAKAALEKYVSLAAKVFPMFGREDIRMAIRKGALLNAKPSQTSLALSEDQMTHINRFLNSIQ